jgi:GT2 family glycosyltransferase
LEQTLPTYLTQEGVGEIIVVDDASGDRTETIVKTAQERTRMPIRYIRHAAHRGPAAARNTGSMAAALPFLMFGEDDVVLDKGYAATLLTRCLELRADLMAGRLIHLLPGETCSDGVRRCDQNSGDTFARPDVLVPDFCIRLEHEIRIPFAHAIFLTRTDLVRRFGFDERYCANAYREETDFQVTLLAHDGAIFMTPDAVCFHLPRTQASSGGVHDRHWLVYEYWTIRNNNYFIHKHYATLRAHFGWARSESQVKMDFVRYRWREWINPKLLYDVRETIRPYVPSRLWHFIGRKLPSRKAQR